jgi:hypothetical protein
MSTGTMNSIIIIYWRPSSTNVYDNKLMFFHRFSLLTIQLTVSIISSSPLPSPSGAFKISLQTNEHDALAILNLASTMVFSRMRRRKSSKGEYERRLDEASMWFFDAV